MTFLGSSHGLLRAPRWGAVIPNAPPRRRTMCRGGAGGPGLVSGGMLPLRRGVRGAEQCCPSVVVCTCLVRGLGRLSVGRGKDSWVRNHFILLDVIGGWSGAGIHETEISGIQAFFRSVRQT